MKFVVVMVYVVMVLMVGYQSMRKTNTVSEFFLGGRNMGPWLSAFAYGTTYFSAVMFIGYAGKMGWDFGLSALWIVAGNTIVGTYLAWKVLAKPTREMTIRLGALTMPQYMEKRFQSVSLKIYSAIIIFIFLVPYSASVYMGLSYFFEKIFNIPFMYALIFMAFLTGCYLVMGGYRAVSTADCIQGIIMILGVFALVYFVFRAPETGGIINSIKKLKQVDPQLVSPVGPSGFLPLLAFFIITSVGPWGLPQMLQKFYAIKSEDSIRPALIVSTFFALIITFGAYFTGAFGRLFYPEGMPTVNGVPNVDMVMPGIIAATLPEIFQLLILLLVLAASMSTLASIVLVASSAIGIDLLETVAPEFAKKRGVLVMRILCIIFIAFSVYLAVTPNIIVNLMSLSWGTIAGVFLAPYLYGLFWKRVTKAGAWAGALAGLLISVGPALILGTDSSYLPLISALAIVAPLAIVPIVSLFTENFSVSHLKEVYGPTNNKGVTSSDLG